MAVNLWNCLLLLFVQSAGDNFNAGFVYGVYKAYGEGKEPAFEKMPVEAWQSLIAFGQRFSSAVCQSFDNYVDKDFNLL